MEGKYGKIEKCLLILIILFSIGNCKIAINVTVDSNKNDVIIKYSGNDKKVVTDKELTLFNITMEKLNKGMRIELGRYPDDIFLKDPTPYGKVFENFEWEEMKRRLKILKTKVVDVLNTKVVLGTHEHINNSPNNITAKRRMFRDVENAVSSTWSRDGVPNDDITYNLTIHLKYGQFHYVNNWRNESIRTVKMPIGVTKDGIIIIKPGQSVITKLSATKTILLVELTYDARIVGSVVANYGHEYGKYHFYAPAVENIMKAANMSNVIFTTEVIEIRCYTNPVLEVYDKLTGETVEPPRKKRPLMKIFRKKNVSRVIFVKTKKIKEKKNDKTKTLKTVVDDTLPRENGMTGY